MKLADASTIEGKVIRTFTSTVAWASGFTPLVGDSIKKVMIDIVSTEKGAPQPPQHVLPYTSLDGNIQSRPIFVSRPFDART